MSLTGSRSYGTKSCLLDPASLADATRLEPAIVSAVTRRETRTEPMKRGSIVGFLLELKPCSNGHRVLQQEWMQVASRTGRRLRSVLHGTVEPPDKARRPAAPALGL